MIGLGEGNGPQSRRFLRPHQIRLGTGLQDAQLNCFELADFPCTFYITSQGPPAVACMSNAVKQYILLLIAMFFWGASWSSTKVLVSIAQPMTIGFFRYSVAAMLFTVLLGFERKTPWSLFTRSTYRSLVLAGVTGIFAFIVLSIIGTGYSTAGQASIIAGLNPVTVTLFAYFVHRERLTNTWQYSGFVLAFLGIVFVVGVQYLVEFNAGYLTGNIILVAAMVLWGAYSAASKSAMKTLGSIEVTAGSVYVGWLMFGVGSLTETGSIGSAVSSWTFWLNVLFLGAFSTVLGFTIFVDSIGKIGATRTGAFNSFVPIFGVAASIVLLGEAVYWTTALGLVFVVLGLLIINAPTADKPQPGTSSDNAKHKNHGFESHGS